MTEMELGVVVLNKHNVGFIVTYNDIYFHEVGFKDEQLFIAKHVRESCKCGHISCIFGAIT